MSHDYGDEKKIGVWVVAQVLMVLVAQQAFAANNTCPDAGSCFFGPRGPFDCCSTTPDGCRQYKCWSCNLGGSEQQFGTYHGGYIGGNSGGLCHP